MPDALAGVLAHIIWELLVHALSRVLKRPIAVAATVSIIYWPKMENSGKGSFYNNATAFRMMQVFNAITPQSPSSNEPEHERRLWTDSCHRGAENLPDGDWILQPDSSVW